VQYKFKISGSKTKVMTNAKGLKTVGISIGHCLELHGMQFEVVSDFKYLGVVFDGRASDKKMINNVLDKARKIFHWLISFLN
jgi:hypothetical protein